MIKFIKLSTIMNLVGLLIITSLILISCDKQPTEDALSNIDPYFGFADLLIGLDSFDFKPYARSSKHHESQFSLNLFYFNTGGILRGQLSFSNIPMSSRIYEIESGIHYGSSDLEASFFTWESDGDVGGDVFDCDSLFGPNYINIFKWDSISGEIQGNFELGLIRMDRSFVASPELSDTLQVSGIFLTKLDYR